MTSPDTPGPRDVELDPKLDVVSLTRALCDIPSVSGQEGVIADAVQAALSGLPHLEVLRDGDAVLARTSAGRPSRVLLAGHLDTVPVAANLPTRFVQEDGEQVLVGRGTVDMKGGVAVFLHLAATLALPRHDVTYVFYDQEEVEAVRNGLGRVARNHPQWLAADFGVLGEPSDGAVEGGCQGTIRVEVTARGVAAHSARGWTGSNAIHTAGAVLDVLRGYSAREVPVDGLVYREGLNAVGITGGIAGNVIPDRCVVTVNYRFAPDRTLEAAEAHLRELFAGFEIRVTDGSPAARPGLDHPAAQEFLTALARPARPKYGWTDVARLGELGVPAVNFGPGDPSLAHKDDERVPVRQIIDCEAALRNWLS